MRSRDCQPMPCSYKKGLLTDTYAQRTEALFDAIKRIADDVNILPGSMETGWDFHLDALGARYLREMRDNAPEQWELLKWFTGFLFGVWEQGVFRKGVLGTNSLDWFNSHGALRDTDEAAFELGRDAKEFNQSITEDFIKIYDAYPEFFDDLFRVYYCRKHGTSRFSIGKERYLSEDTLRGIRKRLQRAVERISGSSDRRELSSMVENMLTTDSVEGFQLEMATDEQVDSLLYSLWVYKGRNYEYEVKTWLEGIKRRLDSLDPDSVEFKDALELITLGSLCGSRNILEEYQKKYIENCMKAGEKRGNNISNMVVAEYLINSSCSTYTFKQLLEEQYNIKGSLLRILNKDYLLRSEKYKEILYKALAVAMNLNPLLDESIERVKELLSNKVERILAGVEGADRKNIAADGNKATAPSTKATATSTKATATSTKTKTPRAKATATSTKTKTPRAKATATSTKTKTPRVKAGQ